MEVFMAVKVGTSENIFVISYDAGDLGKVLSAFGGKVIEGASGLNSRHKSPVERTVLVRMAEAELETVKHVHPKLLHGCRKLEARDLRLLGLV
jgi:hypothetical protein